MSREQERRRRIELNNIAAALRRIEEGCFGYCVRCEEPIAVKRLEFDPATPLCIACASKADAEPR
jgi:DnaK suppressor protein